VAVALDAGTVAEGGLQRLPEDDADILDGVMGVHVGVAGGGDGEIEAAVAAERVEHVVEEEHAGLRLDLALAVDVKAHLDRRLAGAARDGAGAKAERLLTHVVAPPNPRPARRQARPAARRGTHRSPPAC